MATITATHPERSALLAISPVGTHIRPPPSPHILDPFITSDTNLFQTIHMGPAHVSPSLYRLVIGGDVPNPQTLTLSALQSLPSSTITTFHECYGPPTLPPTKNHWRVGNVRWTGVPLRDLLALAGVTTDTSTSSSTSQPSSSSTTTTTSSHSSNPSPSDSESQFFIHAYGLDHGSFASHDSPSYLKDLPLRMALDPRAAVTVAWALNDAPLSLERGWPVRLIVPGWFGTNAVKWLCRLEVRRGRARGLWTDVFYKRVVREGKGAEGVERPVWRVEVNSLITRPREGEVVKINEGDGKEGEEEEEMNVPVEGWAWGWEDVVGVRVSADEGVRWIECVVDERVEFSWQRFHTRMKLARGRCHTIMARARTRSGQVQALDGQRNHVHRVKIEVI